MRTPKSHFETLGKDLIETVRHWRNQPRINRNMFSTHEISQSDQIRWYDSLKSDPTRLYFVFFQDLRPVGMLYFADIGKGACSWGCYLGEEAVWPGSGLILEMAALEYAFNHLNVGQLNAEVFEFNVAAQKMHQVFEYPLVGKSTKCYFRDGVECSLLQYVYLKKDWFEKKDIVLAKLPRQLKEVLGGISFTKR